MQVEGRGIDIDFIQEDFPGAAGVAAHVELFAARLRLQGFGCVLLHQFHETFLVLALYAELDSDHMHGIILGWVTPVESPGVQVWKGSCARCDAYSTEQVNHGHRHGREVGDQHEHGDGCQVE